MPARRRRHPNAALDEAWLEMIIEVQAVGRGFERMLTTRLGPRGPERLRLLTAMALHSDGRTPSELAGKLGLPKSSVSRTVTELEAEGLVAFGDYCGDGRCKSVWLTDAGKAAQAELRSGISQDVLGLDSMMSFDRLNAAIGVATGMRKTLTTWRAYCARGPRRKPTMW